MKSMTLLMALVLNTSAVFAVEKSVMLSIPGMYCASCPIIIKGRLEQVDGVQKVTVSESNKTAEVVFDDQKTSVDKLIETTKNAGYESTVKSEM